MTQGEFDAAVSSGSISAEETESDGGAGAPASPSIPISQFIPLLMQLQSVQLCVSAAPTYIPQTFQEQIVFVFDGTDYFLYLYFNNQWNSFSVSGGGGSGVSQILAGTGISISPGGGTGNVTITCTIDDATLPMSDITTNNVSTSQHGFVPKLPNDATKYLDGTGAFSTPSGGGGGGSFSVKFGTDTSRSMGAASGTETLAHGLGKIPTFIRIKATTNPQSAGATAWSDGVSDGTSNSCVWSSYANTSTLDFGVASYAVYLFDTSNANGQKATVTVDATNIYIAWTKVGSTPGATIALLLEVWG